MTGKRETDAGVAEEVVETTPGVVAREDSGQILMDESSETEQLSLDELRRLKADLENDRRRLMKQHNQALSYATRDLAKRMIPVIDHFNLAIEHGEGGSGVQLALKELLEVLAVEGMTEIQVNEGDEFDPAIHNAMASQPDPGIDRDTIVKVTRRGYRYKDQVLRAPEVIVAQPMSDREFTKDEPSSERS
jgi:molecular chaperone GrpE